MKLKRDNYRAEQYCTRYCVKFWWARPTLRGSVFFWVYAARCAGSLGESVQGSLFSTPLRARLQHVALTGYFTHPLGW